MRYETPSKTTPATLPKPSANYLAPPMCSYANVGVTSSPGKGLACAAIVYLHGRMEFGEGGGCVKLGAKKKGRQMPENQTNERNQSLVARLM